jgi:hypothetical protein
MMGCMNTKPVPHPVLMQANDGKHIVKCSQCGEEIIQTNQSPQSMIDLAKPEFQKIFRRHVAERHKTEDANQAAARIVREATEDH